jgi:hypothetical protein
MLVLSVLSTPPSRPHEAFPCRYQASQADFPAAIIAIKIGMTPFGRSAESRLDRSVVGV